ncbi:MAG: nucleotidyltransferase domain-containing protein [Vicinamibacterales bacterium]
MTIDTDRLIVDELRQALDDVVAVYRFGSTAQETTHRGSDTDLAVLIRQRLSPEARFDIQERIAAHLGHDVDLVDLAAATPVMAIQIVAGGRLLYDGDSAARGLFEDRVFGAYARLNEERRGILERVAAEGTVYGR